MLIYPIFVDGTNDDRADLLFIVAPYIIMAREILDVEISMWYKFYLSLGKTHR